VLGRTLEPGSTILVGRKADVGEGEPEVDLVVVPPDLTAEKVTVPPEEPGVEADETGSAE
jgi:hypothetical protein